MTSTMQRAHVTGTRGGSATMALVRGAVGGTLAGAVFAGVTMWFVASLGDPAKMPLMMIAAIVQGQEALMAGTASPVVGALVHMAMSAAFGVGFALLTLRTRTNGALAVAGTAYGAALYVVNFLVVSPLLFPWFGDANQPFELVIHVVFGTLLSFALFGAAARAGSHQES